MPIVRRTDRRLLIAGIAVFAAAAACYCAFAVTHPLDRWLSPVDLQVYRLGGQVVTGLASGVHHGQAAPLYDWSGHSLKFTYTPFAAIVFTVLAWPSWGLVQALWVAVNIVAFVVAIWVTLGGLGYRTGPARVGGTLLLAGVLSWTEPVQRTISLGQVELVLMALILWDMCQPDRRRWKGAGVGIAAGIKLIPLIFIPYLLLTRRYRQAGVAAGTFALTVALGFAVRPADSRVWWLDGLFAKGSRTGFVGWAGNQSLQALITRLSGSIAAGQPLWLAAAVVTLVIGLVSAAALSRAGHTMLGVLTCALTGLLVSPISWDHHWVWIVPGVTVLVCYGLRARGRARWACLTGAVVVTGLFGAWPGSWWAKPIYLGGAYDGFIWAPPNTNPGMFAKLGDRASDVEYHWSGWQLMAGNVYVLTGMAIFVLLVALAVRSWATRRPTAAGVASADNQVPVVSR